MLKKSLDGLAKMLIQSERGLTSWNKLKEVLKKESEVKTTSAEIHKFLMNRRKGKEETLQKYILIMREIASRTDIVTEVVIQYIVDGIRDEEHNKLILYSAQNFEELKKKPSCTKECNQEHHK